MYFGIFLLLVFRPWNDSPSYNYFSNILPTLILMLVVGGILKFQIWLIRLIVIGIKCRRWPQAFGQLQAIQVDQTLSGEEIEYDYIEEPEEPLYNVNFQIFDKTYSCKVLNLFTGNTFFSFSGFTEYSLKEEHRNTKLDPKYVGVYYNPDNPEDCMINNRMRTSFWFSLAIVTIIAFIPYWVPILFWLT